MTQNARCMMISFKNVHVHRWNLRTKRAWANIARGHCVCAIPDLFAKSVLILPTILLTHDAFFSSSSITLRNADVCPLFLLHLPPLISRHISDNSFLVLYRFMVKRWGQMTVLVADYKHRSPHETCGKILWLPTWQHSWLWVSRSNTEDWKKKSSKTVFLFTLLNRPANSIFYWYKP